MKNIKKILSLIFAAALCLCSAAIFGCSYPELEKLSEEEQYTIRKEYFDDYCRDRVLNDSAIDLIKLKKYLGDFNGTVVIELENWATSQPNLIKNVVIDNVFICEIKNELTFCMAYITDGEQKYFTDLQQAYENGGLTKDNLEEIADRYESISEGKTDAFDGLSESELSALKQEYFDLYAKPHYVTDYDLQYVIISKYLGEYNGLKVIDLIDNVKQTGFPVVNDLIIGGVRIRQLSTSHSFWVYDEKQEDNRFMLLQEAYESGKISRSDLKKIAYYSKL